ncbi:unnamed protein product [Miscanthus lutarioriparius]|uniref:Glycosyltransferase n=1 Tax=Miscanthus lutarioriparius TaxID=422564 RepID=A0A811RUB2_9POAL|nr:unnamed protein product [Miscanthus lutarioriparius]
MPYPAQGHVTPMLKLAKLLHARGFEVTFVNTEFNHRRLLHSRGALDRVPGFRFDAIPDGLPPSDADATQDIPALCYSTMTTCLPHLLALLARVDADAGSPPVTCLVTDAVMSFGFDAAREFGVPVAALWTASACGFMGYRNYRNLIDWGLVPFQNAADLDDVVEGGHLATVVTGARGMCDGVQLRDFPSFVRTTDRADIMLNFLMREAERLSPPRRRHRQHLRRPRGRHAGRHARDPPDGVPRRPAPPPRAPGGPRRQPARGPRLQPLEGAGGPPGVARWPRAAVRGVRELRQHHGDDQPAAARVRVGPGQQRVPVRVEHPAGPGEGRLRRAAAGVRVRRRGPRAADDVVPAGGGAPARGGRGVPDSPGWNSTLESLCAGVPMLSWPFFAEQQTNCRYKRTEWGVGMEIGGEVRRDEVSAILKEAMDGRRAGDAPARGGVEGEGREGDAAGWACAVQP